MNIPPRHEPRTALPSGHRKRPLVALALSLGAFLGFAQPMPEANAGLPMDEGFTCKVGWVSPSSNNRIRFLGAKGQGGQVTTTVAPGEITGLGWATVVLDSKTSSERRCSVHALLELQGIGKLEISERRSPMPQYSCTLAPNDGSIIDAQASGLCKYIGQSFWNIQLPWE